MFERMHVPAANILLMRGLCSVSVTPDQWGVQVASHQGYH